MKLENLNQSLALVANFGVLLGLVVLIVELNQNTRVAELESYQTLIDQIMQLNRDAYSEPQLQAAIAKVNADADDISETDQAAYNLYTLSLIRHGDLAYFQFRSGLIDEARLNSALAILVQWVQRSRQSRDLWQRATQFDPEFKAYVDRQVLANPLMNL